MFNPKFNISNHLAQILMEIQGIKQAISTLPVTPGMLARLRETARLDTVRYSTYIEGNRLTQEQIEQVIHQQAHIPGKVREEKEVLGYYAALEHVEKYAGQKQPISQEVIQLTHALVMAGGKTQIAPTPYRTVQNVIRDASTGKIVYLPPEAKDVPVLMKELVTWLEATRTSIPHPLRAAMAHYQLATIHPYLDGNGRTARLLTTLVLHKNDYGLKGIYSLEEYYAKDLLGYYHALDIGTSHNYYEGRAEADITPWLEYFCQGMLESFSKVQHHALQAKIRGEKDLGEENKNLDVRQRTALTLFVHQNFITSHDIASLFNIKLRTARLLCQTWVNQEFLIIANTAKKNRKYSLNPAIKLPLK